MASKVKKGLLRPLRYLSHMFDGKEPELQIGFPTNVRHVAHIGIDSTDDGPSWMKEYHSAPLPTGEEESESPAGNIWASADMVFTGGFDERTSSESTGPMMDETPFMSPETSPFQQHPRAKKGRRYKKKEGVEAPTDSISGQELPAVPKKNRRRRQKESDQGNKSPMAPPSRLKECLTDAAAAAGKEMDQMLQPQAMKQLAIIST